MRISDWSSDVCSSDLRDTPAKLPLLAKSVARWVDTAMAAGQGAGYLLSGAASFHAAFGDGDAALASLQALLAGKAGIGRHFANTMSAESGPNIQTPPAAAPTIGQGTWRERVG